MPRILRRDILARHRESLRGRLIGCFVRSSTLGIVKPYYVYEPPGLDREQALPVVYLFRGHEREWVNLREDASRASTTAIEDVDRAIVAGALPPLLAVMPGLNSADNHIPSLGINMVCGVETGRRGLGSGRFWDFLNDELFPRIEARDPRTAAGPRLAAGFSLGGFTVALLAVRKPGLFDHAGIYDGLFMWPRHQDPRVKPARPFNDRVWLKNGLFDAPLGRPRSRQALTDWNPADLIAAASPDYLHALQTTRWWIACAASDGHTGNRDRTRFFSSLLRSHRIPLGFDTVLFDRKAEHTWHWTDRFLIRFLKRTLT